MEAKPRFNALSTNSADYDAVVVGAGPNGLSAAIVLAQAGARVLVLEARDTIGGGTRTGELTLPGFRHDVCAAMHPLGRASPFFRSLPLEKFGLEWVFAPASVAHPLDGEPSILYGPSLDVTAKRLGKDGAAYLRLFTPLVRDWQKIITSLLGPLRLPMPNLIPMIRMGLPSLLSARGLSRLLFREKAARAGFGGMAAHSIMTLEHPISAAFGLMLTILAHGVGYPMARGGSQAIADALGAYLISLGGEIRTGFEVHDLGEIPRAKAVLLDVTPKQLISIAGERLPEGYRRALGRFRHGPGVYKLDYALDSPAPWLAQENNLAPTVHLGGTFEEVSESERTIWQGRHPRRPYIIYVQQSQFDSTRAPQGKHTAWAYCHVPNGSQEDMTQAIEDQIERFAPGFRNRILARHSYNTLEMEAYNPNYIGGDINGGVQDLAQFFTRPVPRISPYTTPVKGLFICSSSTPPGGGVHGMCGYFAAQAALKSLKH
jgi:phytoene dehydrogenase-like protein